MGKDDDEDDDDGNEDAWSTSLGDVIAAGGACCTGTGFEEGEKAWDEGGGVATDTTAVLIESLGCFSGASAAAVDDEEVDKLISVNIAFDSDIYEEIEQTMKSIRNRYPLLFGVDEDESLVLEYVEMINERNHKQMKVA